MALTKVQSDRDPSIEYLVDAAVGTCTCPQAARLDAAGNGDVCKHVARLRHLPDGLAVVTEQVMEVQEQVNTTNALALLARPTVDLDELPTLPTDLELQERTACVLVSAVLREETAIEALEKRAREEAIAWADFLGQRKERAKGVRALVRDWMLRTGTLKIQSPVFTISVSKGRTSLTVLDESQAIDLCRALYPAAIKTKESLVMAEFKVAVDSMPKAFAGVVEEKIGDPSLLIRKRG